MVRSPFISFEPFLDASSLRSDVISPFKILSLGLPPTDPAEIVGGHGIAPANAI